MASDAAWRHSWSKRGQIAVIAAMWPLIEGLAGTLSYRAQGTEHLQAVADAGQTPILAFWHGRILEAVPYFRDQGIVVITSANFDGEWIARIIGRFGYGTARGSSSRGGAKALVQMRRALTSGRSVAFTVDGPRGPARVAQPGAAWLAGATGQPIVPFHIEADRYWTAGSWDRQQVPKPGATVTVSISEPLYVPDTEEATVASATRSLEQRLHALQSALLTPHSAISDPRSSILKPQ